MKRRKSALFEFKSRLTLVIIVVVAAFAAAFLGQILIQNLSITPSLSPDDSFIIRQSADNLTLLQRAAGNILENESPGFVEVYRLEGIPVKVAEGIVLTNDGWVAAVPANPELSPQNWQSVRLSSGTFVDILQIIEDSASPLVFIQTKSDSLSPVTLASRFDVVPLELNMLASYGGDLVSTQTMNEVIREALYLSSDEVNRFIKLSGGEQGQTVYNAESELIALVADKTERGEALALPAPFIRDSLQTVLRRGGLERPALGIMYTDLAVQPVTEVIAQGATSGALITTALGPSPTPILPQTSSAYQGGLRLGDIIVSVNGEVVNHRQSLSDYILKYQKGESIELGILRAGEPVSLEVALD